MPKTYDAAYGEFTNKYNLNGFDLMREYEDMVISSILPLSEFM